MITEPGTKYLIVHADDGGLCKSVNRAIIIALETGIVTSTSLMVPCPQFEEIADFFNQNTQYDVGIHLTLTCEYPHYPWRPISDSEKVPSLVNSKGYLKSKNEFIKTANAADVAIELRAQIERFLRTGIRPTHLDTHQGTVFRDMQFLEIYVKLGMEYQIPPMLLKPNEHSLKLINHRGLKIEKQAIEKLLALQIPFLDFLYMTDNYTKSVQETEKMYIQVMDKIPTGISQIIIHPGFDDEDLKDITSHSSNRFYDFSVFTNSAIKGSIENNEIKLIGWKDLANN